MLAASNVSKDMIKAIEENLIPAGTKDAIEFGITLLQTELNKPVKF